jgi:hypothetical protein
MSADGDFERIVRHTADTIEAAIAADLMPNDMVAVFESAAADVRKANTERQRWLYGD